MGSLMLRGFSHTCFIVVVVFRSLPPSYALTMDMRWGCEGTMGSRFSWCWKFLLQLALRTEQPPRGIQKKVYRRILDGVPEKKTGEVSERLWEKVLGRIPEVVPERSPRGFPRKVFGVIPEWQSGGIGRSSRRYSRKSSRINPRRNPWWNPRRFSWSDPGSSSLKNPGRSTWNNPRRSF